VGGYPVFWENGYPDIFQTENGYPNGYPDLYERLIFFGKTASNGGISRQSKSNNKGEGVQNIKSPDIVGSGPTFGRSRRRLKLGGGKL
jgi:hypothetical protein